MAALDSRGGMGGATRWIGVGVSRERDAHAAGVGAATEAVTGPQPQLLVVFASDDHDLPALVAAVTGVAPDVPLVGCSTAGELSDVGAGDTGVVVSAFGGGGFTIETAVARDVSGGLHDAGVTAAAAGSAVAASPHRALLLLTDGLAGDQQEIVRGAYSALGAGTRLVGGCAGDGLRMQQTHQFHGDEVLTDAVVAAAIGSDAPIGIGVEHGWRPVGERLLVTASTGNRVLRINDRPALDIYLEVVDAPEAAHTDTEAFTRFAITHPLGLERRTGTEVRFIGGADFEDRSLQCIANVPQGELAWVMEGDEQSVLDATIGACAAARDQLGPQPPKGLLVFDCIARRGVLGDDHLDTEVGRIRDAFPDTPLAGFYTYGEFARLEGTRGFHNQTLVVMAVA